MYLCYVEESRPTLWSIGQALAAERRSNVFPVRYEQNIYLLCRKSRPFLENRDYGRRGSAALTMRHRSIRKSWN
jgi:hypothetical protein